MTAMNDPESGPLLDTKYAGTLISDFPTSRTKNLIFVVYKLLSRVLL